MSMEKNQIVICDRFIDSTIAYQVYGKKVKYQFIKNIQKIILGKLKPNLTFLLRVSAESSKKRLLKRKSKNRYDNFPKSFYCFIYPFPKKRTVCFGSKRFNKKFGSVPTVRFCY